MIKTSGYRVSPTEIEEAAYATGLVRDAVALGVDDPALGQRIVLVGQRRVGEELDGRGRARRSCGANCRSTWCPSDVVVRDELPRSPNGKFDRNLLRQELAAMSAHPTIAAFGVADGQLAVGGDPARAARRAGRRDAVLRLRPAAARRERVALLRATLPDGHRLSYAVKANPMPAVVQHLSGPRRLASTSPRPREMRTALDTPMPADARQLRRARARRRPS